MRPGRTTAKLCRELTAIQPGQPGAVSTRYTDRLGAASRPGSAWRGLSAGRGASLWSRATDGRRAPCLSAVRSSPADHLRRLFPSVARRGSRSGALLDDTLSRAGTDRREALVLASRKSCGEPLGLARARSSRRARPSARGLEPEALSSEGSGDKTRSSVSAGLARGRLRGRTQRRAGVCSKAASSRAGTCAYAPLSGSRLGEAGPQGACASFRGKWRSGERLPRSA